MRYGDVFMLAFAMTLLRWILMGYAAWRDARTRTFPNGLAATFVLVCAAEAFLNGGLTHLAIPDGLGGLQEGGFIVASGIQALAVNATAATVVVAVLFAFELTWRHFRKTPGIGMGDLKFLFAFMLAEPVKGLIAFMLGIVALALTGLATKRSALPLLPFVVGSYFAILSVNLFVSLSM